MADVSRPSRISTSKGSPVVRRVEVVDLTSPATTSPQSATDTKRSPTIAHRDGVPLRKMANTLQEDNLRLIRAQVRHINNKRLQQKIDDLKVANAGTLLLVVVASLTFTVAASSW